MRLPGRVSAAIEVLNDIITHHRPASEALRDWGKAHRFAGGGDRHAIGTLVYDTLRRRNSAAWRMGDDTPRALVLGTLANVWGWPVDDIAALTTEEHGPAALSPDERQRLTAPPAKAPLHVAADIPEWLVPSWKRVFGGDAMEEGMALSTRAPIDLRVNTLKADRAKVLDALARFGAVAGPLSPLSIRVPAPGPEARNINVENEPSHGLGWFEVQDSASQIAALMSSVKPGERVLDLCAGAGGKTLALAALMKNEGQIVAHDRDRSRLRPIFERLTRAGVSNVEVLAAEQGDALGRMAKFDCVVLDAPCSGSGAWRRKPDAKWKFGQKQLDIRVKEQRDVLAAGAALVKPGGRLVYITCSVLAEENMDQVKRFLAGNAAFSAVPYAAQWSAAIGGDVPKSVDGGDIGLTLSPRQHGTDGFFVAVMRRTA